MGLAFKKAEKRQQKLRLAVFGPSGSGKTMTALRIAKGLGGPVALIDTEHGSASKYADRFEFEALDLTDKTIEGGYIPGFSAAIQGRFPVLIVDSLSHGWDELLEEVDKIAKAKYRGNTWSAWSEGTPKQKKMIEAILSYPGHVICTMRSDTAWEQEKDERGKVKPVKVGLKPRGGKGIEYEFDMLMEITVDHIATVTKDRTGKFQDQHIEKPDEKFGESLVAWLNEGKPNEKPRITPAVLDHTPAPAAEAPQGDAQEPDPTWDEVARESQVRTEAAIQDTNRVVTQDEIDALITAAKERKVTSAQVTLQVRKPLKALTLGEHHRVMDWILTHKA